MGSGVTCSTNATGAQVAGGGKGEEKADTGSKAFANLPGSQNKRTLKSYQKKLHARNRGNGNCLRFPDAETGQNEDGNNEVIFGAGNLLKL